MNRTPEESSVHQQCWELLPWYANGSLNEAERTTLKSHLGTCLVCRRELAYLRKLGSTLHAADDMDVAVQAGLSATMARIDATQQPRQGGRQSPGGVGGWLRRVESQFQGSPPVVKRAMALQFVILLAFGGILLLLSEPAKQPAFETLSAPGYQSAPDRTRLSIAFREGTTEQAVRGLLLALGARIVDGPSTAGRYTVELPIPPTATGPDSLFLSQLRADPRVLHARRLESVSP